MSYMVDVFFDDLSLFTDWVSRFAPMPVGPPVDTIGEALSCPEELSNLSDQSRLQLANCSSGHLAGGGFSARFLTDQASNQASVSFNFKFSDSQYFKTLVEHFAGLSCYYAFACAYEEYFRHHRFRYQFDNGIRVQTMLGTDPYCYLPGLYWCNYLSRRMLSRLDIDCSLPMLADRSQCSESRNGVIVQLAPDVSDWVEYIDATLFSLESVKGVFSLDHIKLDDPLPISKFSGIKLYLETTWP